MTLASYSPPVGAPDATQTMRAAVFHGPGDIRVDEIPRPRPGPGEAVIRISLTTICGTDVHILKGEYPVKPGLIIGHETVGVIEEIGPGVTGFEVGDRGGLGGGFLRHARSLRHAGPLQARAMRTQPCGHARGQDRVAGGQQVAIGVRQQRQALALPSRHVPVLQYPLQRMRMRAARQHDAFAAAARMRMQWRHL